MTNAMKAFFAEGPRVREFPLSISLCKYARSWSLNVQTSTARPPGRSLNGPNSLRGPRE